MDFPAHIIWSLALFKSYSWQAQAVFFGVLPDLVFAVPAVYFWLKLGRPRSYAKIFPHVEPFYRLGHSAVSMLAFFAVASIYFGSPYWPALAGWSLHILLDVPFHKGGFVNGIAPFHPVSKRRVLGKWWWREVVQKKPWIAVANYALALLVYFVA